MRAVWLLFFAPLLAGCLAGDTDSPNGQDALTDEAAAIGAPIELIHDHNNHAFHTGSHNVEFISWSSLDVTMGENGFANFDLWSSAEEQLAFVAVDGDERGGFVIADIADPANIQVLGSYMVPGNSMQEVRVTPDGRFAILNVQDLENDPNALAAKSTNPDYCPACMHVVNVQDRNNPTFSSYTPVELLGTHNMDFQEQDGTLYVYYVGQPLSYNGTGSEPGNHIWVGQFIDSGDSAAINPLYDFNHDTSGDEGRSFPHDIIVDEHPLTGQHIGYVSHWDGGAITFDVTDPANAAELDIEATWEPSEALAIHWFKQEDWVRADGKVYAWSAPEIGALGNGTGVIRGYDVTDPSEISQISSWGLPGELFIEDAFILSPHTVNVDPETGIAAVSHYHAGIWLLDVSDPTNPRHVGYYLPHGEHDSPYDGPIWWKKPNFNPSGYGPNAYQVRWDDRGDETILWATDRGTGLYALRYTGQSAGPIAA